MPNVRTAVLVYESSAAARSAVDQLDEAAFEDCLVTTTNGYLNDDATRVRPRCNGRTAFDTKRYDAPTGQATYASTFYEDVLGGFDNAHGVALFVGREGPVVTTAVTASNSQQFGDEEVADLARATRRVGQATLTPRNDSGSGPPRPS